METIICLRCQLPKDSNDFSPDARNSTGKQSRCRVCVREARIERHEANRAQGLCFCGAERNPPAMVCTRHQDVFRGHYKRYRSDPQMVERMLDQNRKSHHDAKLAAFDAYGGRLCKCCGETHIEFLSIDHIGGVKSDDDPRKGGNALYFWLRKKKYPSGFRVLCMNCNFAMGHAGYCPHGNLEPIVPPKRGGRPRTVTKEP